MDDNRDLQLLLLALRGRAIDPNRLADAAAEWPSASGPGLMTYLVGRGVLAEDDLRRLEAETEAPAAASVEALPTTAYRGGSGDVTPGRAEGETPPAAGGAPAEPPAPAERYKVVRLHQTGGLGQVWLARDTAVGRDVALKTLRPDRAGYPAVRARFVREARVTGQLEHPSIVPLYDLAAGATEPFYVMRFVSGRTLAEAAADYHRRRAEGKAGPLDLGALLDAFVSVCRAVAFAHSRNVLHRDLKGQNIVVGEFGEVFLLDWGLAKSLGEPEHEAAAPAAEGGEGGGEMTAPGSAVGTPAYMAPEVAAGGTATRAADVYGLGAILYGLLTGRAPYGGATAAEVIQKVMTTDPPPVRELSPSAPPALAAVCRKAMARDPAGRYASADEVATEVRRWLADEPVAAYRERWPARAARWARRRKTLVVAAAVLLLTAAVASTAAAALVWREQRQTAFAWKQASQNAEAAVEVVHDLSGYVEAYETDAGNRTVNSLRQRKERLDLAVASYERLLALHPEDPNVRWHVARLHRLRGNLCRFLDQTDEAEKSYGEAIRLFERLAADFPDKINYRENHALALQDFGGHLRRLGRHQEAARITDDTVRLYQKLHHAHPDQPNYVRNLAILFMGRSDWELQVGRLAESERAARESADLYAQLAQMPGNRPGPLDPLFHAMAEHNLALALREQGRLDEALAAHDRAAERMAGLVKVTGDRDAWSFLHRVRTERAWTMGRVPARAAEAVADLEGAIAGWDRLIKQLGENPVDLERKGVAGLYCGRLKLLAGRREEAARDLAAAAAILEKLVARQAKVPAYRYDLGRIYTALGQTAGDAQAAADWYRKAREMLDAAVRQYPENVPFRQALAELDALTSATR